jgi:hypothetical protein
VDETQDEIVLLVAELGDLLLARMHVARGQEVADPVLARLPIHVAVVVRTRVELVPVGLERLLPRPRVRLRRAREHAVEVEQAGGDAVGKPEHSARDYFRRNARMRSSYWAMSRA